MRLKTNKKTAKSILIDSTIHKLLKIEAVSSDKTIRDFTESILSDALTVSGGRNNA